MAHNYTHLENFPIVQASNQGIKGGEGRGACPMFPKEWLMGQSIWLLENIYVY